MLSSWDQGLIIALALLATVQGVLVLGYLMAMRRERRSALGSKTGISPPGSAPIAWPRVRVVLCVRGADPSLARCVQAIAALDYPDFRLAVVADDLHDKGLASVRRVLGERFSLFADELVLDDQDRLESCSMKCSALIRACRNLPEEVEYIATVDADTLPTADWLKRLIAPMLQDPRIGATTGVRWYTPNRHGAGAWARSVWNGAAIVQMWAYSIPWGGSMAVRRTLLEQAGLLNRWSETFCEDTPTASQLSRFGYRVRTVTGLILDNDENCRLRDVAPWVRRQLLTARLHHPAWAMVLGHAVMTTGAPLIALVRTLIAAWQQDYATMAWVGGSLIVYQSLMVALVWAIATGVEQTKQGVSLSKVALQPVHRLVQGVVLSQVFHPWAAIGAAAVSAVTWRQIRYAVLSRGRVRRLDYAPYQSDTEAATESL